MLEIVKYKEWGLRFAPWLHGVILDNTEWCHCDACGAIQEDKAIPDSRNPRVPYWPKFLAFVENHKECGKLKKEAQNV